MESLFLLASSVDGEIYQIEDVLFDSDDINGAKRYAEGYFKACENVEGGELKSIAVMGDYASVDVLTAEGWQGGETRPMRLRQTGKTRIAPPRRGEKRMPHEEDIFYGYTEDSVEFWSVTRVTPASVYMKQIVTHQEPGENGTMFMPTGRLNGEEYRKKVHFSNSTPNIESPISGAMLIPWDGNPKLLESAE